MSGKRHIFVICAYKESPYLEDCIRSLEGQQTAVGSGECRGSVLPEMRDGKRSEMGAGTESGILIATSTPNAHIDGLGEKYGIPVKRFPSAGKGEKCSSSDAGAGIAADWNHALACGREAGADYVTLAHQDDVYEPGYREAMVRAAVFAEERGERPLIVFSDYYEIRETGRRERESLPQEQVFVESEEQEPDLQRFSVPGEKKEEPGSDGTGKEILCSDNKNLRIKRMLLAPLKNKGLRQTKFGKRCALRLGNAICCPAVTYVMKNLPEDPFQNNMGSNIDWQLWEELSRQKGSFVYVPERLMGHRIHEGSTTSELIEDSRRKEEDLYMLRKFWPGWIANLMERPYQSAEKSNRT